MILLLNKLDNSLVKLFGPILKSSSNGLNQHISQNAEVAVFLPLDITNKLIEHSDNLIFMNYLFPILIYAVQNSIHECFMMV